MRRREQDIKRMFDHSFPRPSREQTQSACERVLRCLNSAIEESPGAKPARAPIDVGVRRRWAIIAIGAAAVLLLMAASLPFMGIFDQQKSVSATVLEGSIYWISGAETHRINAGETVGGGKLLHANGSAGAVLALADGSRIESRMQSELTLEEAEDGVRIRLHKGVVIVSAARQRTGHLYVQTKDITVSVVGTVFLVNAEEAGSRVAVIEGVVQVQQGGASKTLSPGEQVATAPSMEPVPVTEEISWSRNASTHLALLQQTTAPAPTSASGPTRLEFEVASIRPELTVTQDMKLNADIAGFSCHGTDGVRRSPVGQLATTAAQGRCSGRYVSLGVLVGYAYDLHPRRVRGVPDWRPPGKPIDTGFQIEARAEDPATATLADLKKMLQSLLVDYFKVEFHRETTECQGYALEIAAGAPKLTQASDEDEIPPYRTAANGREILKGKSELAALASALTDSVGMPVMDRTQLAGAYDYTLSLNRVFVAPLNSPNVEEQRRGRDAFPAAVGGVCGGNGPRVRPRGAQNQAGEARELIGYDPPVAQAVEEQLGLRLSPARVQVETIIIDRATRPALITAP